MAQRVSRSRHDPAVSGSVVVWLAGLVFGLGVGVVMVYHLVAANRSGAELPVPPSARPAVLQASAAAPAVAAPSDTRQGTTAAN